MREYRIRKRKVQIRKRLLALAMATTLGIGGFVLIKNHKANKIVEFPRDLSDEIVLNDPSFDNNSEILVNDEYVVSNDKVVYDVVSNDTVISIEQPVIEQPVTYGDRLNRGDSVVSTTNVNLRLNSSADSFKLGELPKGTVVDRILSTGDWDLVKYNGKLAYVCSDYTRTNDIDYNNEYYYVEEDNDIVRTTTNLYFRVGPSTKEQDICLLDKNEELVVIGKTTSYSDPSDVWYIVRARGAIGFVKAEYTKSLKSMLVSYDPSITNVEVKKVGYLKSDTPIRDNPNGNILSYADKYQVVQVLQSDSNWSLVNLDGFIGFVENNAIKNIKGTFVVVDISSQRIYMYCDTDIAFAGKCTTGKDSSPTELGVYNPYGKASSHEFHDNLNARILWMPFNGGQGLHDAPWEKNSNFGDPSYTHKHGSAGCVRLPDSVAEFIFNNVSKNSTVLVKK